jgi:hypothetical protein
MLVELAIEAADNEDACAFVKKMVKEMKKKVQNIKKGSIAALDNEDQLLSSNDNEIANHSQFVEKLLETVKGFKIFRKTLGRSLVLSERYRPNDH